MENKNVLILNGFESNIPAFEKTNRGLSAALQAGGIGIRNQFYEHLDLARNPGPEHGRHLADLLRLRYGGRRIDFIVTLYPEGLQFVLEQDQAVLPNVPILALYLPQGFALPDTGRQVIPHLVVPDLKRTLDAALRLVPRAKRLYVVAGAHPVDKWLENLARQDFKTWKGGLEPLYLSDRPLEEILAAVSTAPSSSIVLITSFGQDVTGRYQTTVEVSRQLARISKVPVFGLFDTLLGHGIAGGSLISFERIGAMAGGTIVDILRGGPQAQNIPNVLDVPQLDTFDWRQLRRWNLSEGALPAGSILVNREFSLWDLKYYAVGILAFILAQSVLIVRLVVQKRRRRSAEDSLRHKTNELDQFFNVFLDLLCIANNAGYFLRVNPVWEPTLGYTLKELLAKRFLEFVHPEDLARTQGAIATLASQGEVIRFENRYRRRDGTYRWLEWNAFPSGNLIYAAARDVTQRRLDEEALQKRLRFEALISDLSARFVNLPPDKVGDEINRWLRTIAEFFDVDRCTIGLFSEDLTLLSSSFEYHSADSEPAPASISKEQLPWYIEQLVRGNPVVMSRVEDLPPEAESERRLCVARGMKSLLSIPMVVGNRPMGSCVLVSARAERAWPEPLVQRFQLVSRVFGSALERRRMEDQLNEHLREIEELKQRLENENVYLREEVMLLVEHSEIVGQGEAIKRILAQVQQVAATDSTVLILGETGTGKELVARAIHGMSGRRDRPLITVNCASLPPTLIESELFGREKGAYTGAMTRMAGRFELAHGSTLFLDEIGEIPLEAQSKLLRVLDEGRFERLGSAKSVEVNVRIIAATNRDLDRDVREGKFRNDLYYRLNVFPIMIPPLRERPEDIPLLVWAFIKQFEKRIGKRIESVPKKGMEALQGYPWPGNVRELRNVIEHAMIVSHGGILAVNVPKPSSSERPETSKLETMERSHILDVLRKVNWRVAGKGGAAEVLGLKRTTLQSLMKKLNIKRPGE